MQQRRTSPIRAARTKARLSQSQLSARLGVTKSAVSGWETGREIPHATRLAGLARALSPHLDLVRYCEHLERAA
jgi:transcriptional regulator with XRE-family HTH domain